MDFRSLLSGDILEMPKLHIGFSFVVGVKNFFGVAGSPRRFGLIRSMSSLAKKVLVQPMIRWWTA